jgi:hypothetical protein
MRDLAYLQPLIVSFLLAIASTLTSSVSPMANHGLHMQERVSRLSPVEELLVLLALEVNREQASLVL